MNKPATSSRLQFFNITSFNFYFILESDHIDDKTEDIFSSIYIYSIAERKSYKIVK